MWFPCRCGRRWSSWPSTCSREPQPPPPGKIGKHIPISHLYLGGGTRVPVEFMVLPPCQQYLSCVRSSSSRRHLQSSMGVGGVTIQEGLRVTLTQNTFLFSKTLICFSSENTTISCFPNKVCNTQSTPKFRCFSHFFRFQNQKLILVENRKLLW